MLIREPVPGDQGYVVKTWTRNLLSVKPWRAMPRAQFAAVEAGIERLMDRDDTRALIATAVAPDLCGWLVWTPMGRGAVVHYVYVRKHERTRGIARALFERAGIKRDAPLAFTFKGPCQGLLREKSPAALHMSLDDFFDPTSRKARP